MAVIVSKKCTACKGKGTTGLKIMDSHGASHMQIKCFWCQGLGMVSPSLHKQYLLSKRMWCKCTGNVDNIFYDDGDHPDCKYKINKHHYHCSNCYKITQIG